MRSFGGWWTVECQTGAGMVAKRDGSKHTGDGSPVLRPSSFFLNTCHSCTPHADDQSAPLANDHAATAAGSSSSSGGGGGSGGSTSSSGGSSSSPIMILDEIDSGVGSRLGQPVGRILRSMVDPASATATSQILCVSHLPQVGCFYSSREELRLPWYINGLVRLWQKHALTAGSLPCPLAPWLLAAVAAVALL